MLSQCPHFNTTCSNPGAGVICPLADTTLSPETTSDSEIPQTMQEMVTSIVSAAKDSTTPYVTKTDTVPGNGSDHDLITGITTENILLEKSTMMTDILNVNEASVSQDVQSSANETQQTPLLITAILLVVIFFSLHI